MANEKLPKKRMAKNDLSTYIIGKWYPFFCLGLKVVLYSFIRSVLYYRLLARQLGWYLSSGALNVGRIHIFFSTTSRELHLLHQLLPDQRVLLLPDCVQVQL